MVEEREESVALGVSGLFSGLVGVLWGAAVCSGEWVLGWLLAV